MGKPKLPALLEDKIVREYERKKSAQKVAKRFGVGATTVLRVLKRNCIEPDGLDLYRKQITKLPNAVTLQMDYEAGLSESQIAKKYKAHRVSVHEALIKFGIARRPRGNSYRKFSDEEIQKIISLYKMIPSQTAVAEAFGTSQIQVSRILRARGICDDTRPAGARHGSWKGGKCKTAQGYVLAMVSVGDPLRCMSNKAGYVMEHRLVMARALGRPLTQKETVHHINGDKTDNRLENLQLRHGKHGRNERMRCRSCGSHDIECVEID